MSSTALSNSKDNIVAVVYVDAIMFSIKISRYDLVMISSDKQVGLTILSNKEIRILSSPQSAVFLNFIHHLFHKIVKRQQISQLQIR